MRTLILAFRILLLVVVAGALSAHPATGAAAQPAATLAPGDYEFALDHGGFKRSYVVHVPPQAAGGRALPIVLSFHGGGSNAQVMRTYTRMDPAADRDGYIAVYPNGSSGYGGRFLTWNAGNCCGPAAALQVDDVGFTLALLDDLALRIPYDRRRVYATGLSNGAMMAYRFAAEASERVAAVVGVAGTMSLPRFAPRYPVPVLHIHSTHDHIARFDGGLATPTSLLDTRMFHTPVEDMLRRWLDHDGCPLKPARVETIAGGAGTPDETHSAIRRVHAPCRQDVEVVLLQLYGAGHVWPGGVRDYNPQFLGTGTAVVDANSEIWRFVSRYTR